MTRLHGRDAVTMEGFMRAGQYRWFERFFDEHRIAHVGETGFNAGHSAFTFANLGAASITSFDLGEHAYVTRGHEYLKRRFPNTQFNLVLGDSRVTLPKHTASPPFDLVFVDGGHSQEVAANDIRGMASLAVPNALLVVDNYTDKPAWMTGPREAYDQAVNEGLVEPQEVVSGAMQEWALGRYVQNG